MMRVVNNKSARVGSRALSKFRPRRFRCLSNKYSRAAIFYVSFLTRERLKLLERRSNSKCPLCGPPQYSSNTSALRCTSIPTLHHCSAETSAFESLCRVLDEPTVFSFERSLRSIARFQFSEDARHMILYCALGEEERAGNFAVACTLRNKSKYLDFTFRQRLDY